MRSHCLYLLLSLVCILGIWSARASLPLDLDSSDLDLDLVATVARLTTDLQHLHAKVSTLEKLEARVIELEEKLDQKCNHVAEETEGIAEVADRDKEASNKDVKEQELVSASRDGTARLRRGIVRSPESVAFSAVASHPLVHLGLRQIIKYDKVITNIGHGYSPNSGVFTAPSPGTYLFLYHLGHHAIGETWVDIKKNGTPLNGFAVEGTTGGQNVQGSNSVVLALEAGDEVWVDVFQVNDVTAHELFTTFSGVML